MRDLARLTEKEKETLRLIVRGHDAKSAARTLGLSVHTIHDRLREARRKVAVPSSREAARLLFEAEGGTPDNLGPHTIGEATPVAMPHAEAAPIPGAERPHRSRLTTGVMLMLPALALLAVVAATQLDPASPSAGVEEGIDPAAIETARTFVTLIDAKRWDASYAVTGAQLHKVNTLKLWTDVSEKVRAPLGPMVARTLISAEFVAAPPHGYDMVKFRTQFANKTVIESVTLNREHGDWRVVGVVID